MSYWCGVFGWVLGRVFGRVQGIGMKMAGFRGGRVPELGMTWALDTLHSMSVFPHY